MDSLDEIAAVMRANIPPGITPRQFGQEVMRWGTGSAMARRRMATLTAGDMKRVGLTAEMADNWAAAYDAVARLMPNNPSATGRAELMRHTANLLRGV